MKLNYSLGEQTINQATAVQPTIGKILQNYEIDGVICGLGRTI